MSFKIKIFYILLGLVIFGAGLGLGRELTVAEPTMNINTESREIKSLTIMIDNGSGAIRSLPDITFNVGETLFDVLKKITTEKKIEFDYKDYGGGLGMYIRSIDGKKENNGRYWQFWVNGRYSERGVSNIAPRPRDVIEFKLVQGQLN